MVQSGYEHLETLEVVFAVALNVVRTRPLADLYVRREYTGEFRIKVQLRACNDTSSQSMRNDSCIHRPGIKYSTGPGAGSLVRRRAQIYSRRPRVAPFTDSYAARWWGGQAIAARRSRFSAGPQLPERHERSCSRDFLAR
jgi:hypothetical protein